MRKVTAILSTAGTGYWSDVARDVKITSINISYINDEQNFGELRVYFDTKTWDTYKDGLIYTDSKFLAQLQELLTRLGYAGQDVDYSEQGMQGTNYVSLDVGGDFLKSYMAPSLESIL